MLQTTTTATESSLTAAKTPCAAEETQPNDTLMNTLKKRERCLCNCVYCMFLSSAYTRDFIAREDTPLSYSVVSNVPSTH